MRFDFSIHGAALVFLALGVGCASVHPPEVRQQPTTWYSQKPLRRNAWTDAGRVVVISQESGINAGMIYNGGGLLDVLGSRWFGASMDTGPDLSADFAQNARSILERRGMAGAFHDRLEGLLREESPADILFIRQDSFTQEPFVWYPFDKLVVVQFSPSFVGVDDGAGGSRVLLHIDVSWMVFLDPAKYRQMDRERKQADFAVNWKDRYNALCDAYGFFSQESMPYGRQVWFFNEGYLMKDEMRKVVDRAARQIVGDLFQARLPAFRLLPICR